MRASFNATATRCGMDIHGQGRVLQRVASILACPQGDVTSANQTNPSSRPQMCIIGDGSCSLKPAVSAIVSLLAYYQDSTVGVFDNRFGDTAQQCSSDTTLARAAHHYQPSVYLLGNNDYLRCSLSHTQVRLCDRPSSCF